MAAPPPGPNRVLVTLEVLLVGVVVGVLRAVNIFPPNIGVTGEVGFSVVEV